MAKPAWSYVLDRFTKRGAVDVFAMADRIAELEAATPAPARVRRGRVVDQAMVERAARSEYERVMQESWPEACDEVRAALIDTARHMLVAALEVDDA